MRLGVHGYVRKGSDTAEITRAVHALMHETNASRAISARTGATMRRYALFACRLS